MFNKRKKEIEAINGRLNQIEKITSTVPGIVAIEERLNRLEQKALTIPEPQALQDVTEPNDDENWQSEEKKRRAAYALNLCTVSVSQIVDYNDLYVLEQEYDGILNNLNLENIPHDDVLLDVLKRILDTITFFRIQEGDKRFIEEEYRQKTKSRIWSAVPQLSVVLASPNPAVMIGALITQVGIGYMNYRKEKAKNQLEHEKELWQLQRSAIEQFNALRRELFNTAWNLADRYQFPDTYRLTERQIAQYNQILMDPDPLRRYERLKYISGGFSAYPNFHFYIGDAAYDIANDESRPQEIREFYRKMAVQHFRKFNDITDKPLLRIDPVTSACCLELVGLLDPVKDKEEIKRCLAIAAEKSGDAMDILQICALGFLRINATEDAEQYLRKLSVEGYNLDLNTSLLSILYFRDYTSTKDEVKQTDIRTQHESLSWIAPSSVLLPLPSENTEEAKELARQSYLAEKSDILKHASHALIDKLIKKNTAEFNRKFLNPKPEAGLPDEYFMDSDEWVNDIDSIFHKSSKKKELLGQLAFNEDFFEEILDRINNIDRRLQALPFFREINTHYLSNLLAETDLVLDRDAQKNDLEYINDSLLELQREADSVKRLIREQKYNNVSLQDIQKFSLSKILASEYTATFEMSAGAYLDALSKSDKAIGQFSEYENILLDICNKEQIKVPLGKSRPVDSSIVVSHVQRRIGEDLYDEDSLRIKEVIKSWYDGLDEDKKHRIRFFLEGTGTFIERWASLRKEKATVPFSVNSLLAIMVRIDNLPFSELYLTRDSLFYRKSTGLFRNVLMSIPYSDFGKEAFIPKEYYELYKEITAGELFNDIARILAKE